MAATTDAPPAGGLERALCAGGDATGDNMDASAPERERPGVMVPRPEKVKAIILAESPSAHLLPVYRVSRTFDDASARRMVFAAAEPGRLLVRIDRFLQEMGDGQREAKMAELGKLFHFGHLVYLSKEPAEERTELGRFTPTSVRDEVDGLLGDGARIVVALGEAAQSWVRNNFPADGVLAVMLPVPSNHVSDWFPSFMERMSRERGADTLKVRDAMAAQIDMLVRALSAL